MFESVYCNISVCAFVLLEPDLTKGGKGRRDFGK